MKIVTYNVNGLRPRISQFGSLLKLLDSIDADIICFQETKLSKQELRAEIVRVDGYESFFSCSRATDKGRVGYSGVATFCRVKSAFSSNEVALPLAAEEGFTGLLENFRGVGPKKDEIHVVEGLEGFTRDELLKVDSEGRCIITDHGHFVLFNVYGPRADSDDTERIQFKLTFYKILQRRWESLLHQGRRILVVGDLNIAPAAIDRCDAGPDFEKNEFRRWFRSLLLRNGGSFFDVFREKHPDRRDAYTCWPTNSGAEIFNFGTRIDHILSSGPCLHEENKQEDHNFVNCHVKECDILTQFKRWKPGNTPSHRWKGGSGVKLEGSDHAPVYISLLEIPNIQQHSTPSLSTRYYPRAYGSQPTIASLLMKKQSAEQVIALRVPCSFSNENTTLQHSNQNLESPSHDCSISSSNMKPEGVVSGIDECFKSPSDQTSFQTTVNLGSNHTVNASVESKRKEKQLSLRSFFQSSVNCHSRNGNHNDEGNTQKDPETNVTPSSPDQQQVDTCHSSGEEKRNLALMEWQRIQQLMHDSIPLCKGHDEPCVARVVKKAGPNMGRRFYVCGRAEGPASNPEANCGFFKWASSTSKRKR